MRKTKLLAASILSLAIVGTMSTNVNAACLNDYSGKVLNNRTSVICNNEDLQALLNGFGNCIPNVSDLLNNGNCLVINQNNSSCGQSNCDQSTCTEEPGTVCPGNENTGTGKPDVVIPETESPGAVTPGNEDKGEASASAYAEQVVALVNAERAKYGLSPLTLAKDVEAAALVRAKEIQSSFSHTRPNGSSCFTALDEQNVSYRGAGENIAYGQKTPEEVMKGWMNSEGHRANILNGSFTTIGVGYLQSAQGTNYWTQFFTY